MGWRFIACAGVIVLAACEPAKISTVTERRQADQAAQAARIQADREKARITQAKVDCGPVLEDQKRKYKALFVTGRYWDAAAAIRVCAGVMGDPELTKLVADAELQSYLQDIKSPKKTAIEKLDSFDRMAGDFPDQAKLHADLGKRLVVQAAAQEKADAAREKATAAAKRRKEGVHIGMTSEEVRGSSWGKPDSINTTTTKYGTREQWVYGIGNYLYFENGKLTAIQN